MPKISIRPTWRFESAGGEELDQRIFRLLAGIRASGKLSAAASHAGMSYRHGWDLLHRAAALFGSPLVTMERGRGSMLTTLGEKLLWAEQRSAASLFPQLDNVASELNLEIAKARRDTQAVLRIHASHGYAIEKLPRLTADSARTTVDLQYMSSFDALASLAHGNCDLAGFHVPLGPIGRELWAQYAEWLKPREHKIIRMVLRTQGLFVAAGNPKGLRDLRDLARQDVRFVNRQRGSGTRVLLDGLLRAAGIAPAQIQGYDSGEFTHAAVAAFVASGMVDAAFGVEPAARRFKLDFLPVVQERYMLACRSEALPLASIQELIEILQGDAFAALIAAEPGYAPDAPGTTAELRAVVP